MSIQSQLNSLISQGLGVLVDEKKQRDAAALAEEKTAAQETAKAEKAEAQAKKDAEKAERETKQAQEAELRNKAYESLAEQLKTANEQSKGMQERINYLSTARGAAEVIGEAGLLSNKRQRELVRAAQKKEGDV